METYKAPISTSIKERIKLNKQLTISQRTGRLIGVKANSRPKDSLYSSGFTHFQSLDAHKFKIRAELDFMDSIQKVRLETENK